MLSPFAALAKRSIPGLIQTPQRQDLGYVIMWAIHAISAFSGIIPLIIGLRRFARLQKGLKFLTINLLIALLVEIFALVLSRAAILESAYLYSLYTPVEYILFILMFKTWYDRTAMQRFLTISIPLFLVIWTGSIIWWLTSAEPMETFLDIDNLILVAQSVLFTIISIITLFKILRDETTPVITSPVFWVTAAILLYFSGNLFLFIFRFIILEDFASAWYLHTFLNLSKNLLFALGMLYAGKKLAAQTEASVPEA